MFWRADGVRVLLDGALRATLSAGGSSVSQPSHGTLNGEDPPLEQPGRDESELWPRRKSLFLIEKFKEFKEDARKKMKTKRQMWAELADSLNNEFPETPVSWSQVENRWRTLERQYKKHARHQNTSGSNRARPCQFQR